MATKNKPTTKIVSAFYTLAQAGAISNLSSATLHRMIKAKRLRAFQPTGKGGKLMIAQGNLVEFLSSREKK